MRKETDPGVTAGPIVNFGTKFDDYVPHSETVAERVDKWYIRPLREMGDQHGLLILMLIFPLYERHLRVSRGMKREFSEGNSVFTTIGKHFGSVLIRMTHMCCGIDFGMVSCTELCLAKRTILRLA